MSQCWCLIRRLEANWRERARCTRDDRRDRARAGQAVAQALGRTDLDGFGRCDLGGAGGTTIEPVRHDGDQRTST
jgi:hypothetical protein